MRLFLVALLLALPRAVAAAPVGPSAQLPSRGTAHAALQGSWRVLGPASAASVPLMLEFTFQAAEPTETEMSALFLTAEEQGQVRVARKKVAANPTSAEVVEMQATLAALDAARIEIDAAEITAVSPDGETRLSYRVLRSEGITLTVETTDPSGAESTILFTLPAPGLLMMGPPQGEPLVLRRR